MRPPPRVAVLAVLVVFGALLAAPGVARKKTSRARAGATSGLHIETLPDGLTLVHVPRPGSGRVSMRFAVRAGGNDEPDDRAGLAHLLEHLVFHGTYTTPEGKLFDDARAQGAIINAFTSPEWTIYALDGAVAGFVPLAGDYLRTLSNPALPFARLKREKDVVLAEQEVRNARSLLWGTDQLVFPHENRGRSVIGTRESRELITTDELVAFYEQHYVPAESVAIFVGDLALHDARALLASSMLLPPSSPIDRGPPPTPNLPSEAKVRSWGTATAIGYGVDESVPEAVCDDVALALEAEAHEALIVEEPIAREVAVWCYRTRGQRLLVGVALSANSRGSQLPVLLDAVFTRAARSGVRPAALKAAQARSRAQLAQLDAELPRLADALAFAAGTRYGTVEKNLRGVLRRSSTPAPALKKALQRTVQKKRRFLVHFSPFEGG